MRIKTNKYRLLFLFVPLLVLWSVLFSIPEVSAQDDPEELKNDISDIEKKLKQAEAKKRALESELAGINVSLSSTQRAIAETQIKIQQAANTIERKEAEVALLEAGIADKKGLITGLMRELYYQGEWPLPRILVTEEHFTEVVNDPDKLLTVGEKIASLLNSLTLSRADTESEKLSLEDAKKDHETLLQKKAVEKNILVSDQQETIEDVEDVAKTVNRLKKELAELQGDLATLTGKSYNAKDIREAVEDASNETGVPEGVLYGFLKMETNLGANTGQCTYSEVEKVSLARYKKYGKKYQASINLLSKRKEIFYDIVDALGYNKSKKVSCSPNYIGQGGAMGVAQFMSDVWRGYEAEIRSKTGHKNPDPWSLTDGVMAMALKLRKAGATSDKEAAIRRASINYLGAFNAHYYNGIVYWSKNYKKLFN
ncbi:MAG: lytic murein transglycosylase [Candidatus Moraniibacteriota bacterium]